MALIDIEQYDVCPTNLVLWLRPVLSDEVVNRRSLGLIRSNPVLTGNAKLFSDYAGVVDKTKRIVISMLEESKNEVMIYYE